MIVSTEISAAGAGPSRTIATTIARKLPDTFRFDERMLAAVRSLPTAKARSRKKTARFQSAVWAVAIATATLAARSVAFRETASLDGRVFTRAYSPYFGR